MTTTRGFSDNRQACCPMLAAAARCMLVDISSVTVLCCSTAAAVEVTYSLTLWIACLMDLSAVKISPEMPLSDPISWVTLSVACFA
jgi:hypothetical protein